MIKVCKIRNPKKIKMWIFSPKKTSLDYFLLFLNDHNNAERFFNCYFLDSASANVDFFDTTFLTPGKRSFKCTTVTDLFACTTTKNHDPYLVTDAYPHFHIGNLSACETLNSSHLTYITEYTAVETYSNMFSVQ